ncbi:MAG: hypothetical protein SPF89_12105 [Sphaerochaetaceae bacterium]|nr:hypothetical protein [Sphaerochaetaceae bacterium]
MSGSIMASIDVTVLVFGNFLLLARNGGRTASSGYRFWQFPGNTEKVALHLCSATFFL